MLKTPGISLLLIWLKMVYEVTGEGILTLFTRTNFDNEESVKRFSRQLRSYGLEDALKQKGVQPGDEYTNIWGYLFELVD